MSPCALWERQLRESDEAYEAFQIYLSLGAERSIRTVAQRCTKNESLIKRWSSRDNWVERVRAYDNWLFAEENKAQLKVVRQRAINKGKLSDHAFKAKSEQILYIASKHPSERTRWEVEFIMQAERDGYNVHKEMFALDAQEQTRADIERTRIDLEYLRIEAAHSLVETEGGGSNLIEALMATVPDERRITEKIDEKEGGDEQLNNGN